jgi:hypothetical protein
MTTDPAAPSAADDAAFDAGARLAAGLAHEFGGLLFALRMRIETLEATVPPDARRDVVALAAGLRELQSTIDTLRLLGARPGTGRMVRERAVDGRLWLERVGRLAHHVVPRGVLVATGEAPDHAFADLDLARLTTATLLLAAHAGGAGAGAVLLEPSVAGGGDELTITVRRETPPPEGLGGASPLVAMAGRIVAPLGGEARAGAPERNGPAMLIVPLPGAR